jgi:spore coat polysaccharide biosynthesis predicted glycosyltransferase SpsG
MLGADVAISGGGQTLYELAATGTPAVAIRLADNQTLNLRNLQAAGMLLWAGDAGDADLETMVTSALMVLAENRGRRTEMSRRGRALVDGRGAARVAAAVLDEVRR